MTPHQARYLAYELTKRGPADSIEKFAGTLADAKVDMNPHQVEAALFAFKSPLSRGAILADEVGLGKTIEAGIVLSQFWAEGKQRILLLVPASLRKQWQNELVDKFYLPSTILEGPSFNKALKAGVRNPFDTRAGGSPEIVICSHPFAAGKDDYLLRTPWDLVVIDEAHRLRNVHSKASVNARKLRTALAGRRKILLTATPLQNNLLELYGLVSFIDEHAFGEKQAFSAQYNRTQTDDSFADLKRRLQPLCHRTLRRQVLEYIRYTARSALTQDFTPSAEEQALYDLVSEYLRRPGLHALPASQRQLITLVLRKLLASSSFAIAGALHSMHRRLERMLHDDDLRNESRLADDLGEDTDGGFDELAEEWTEDPAPRLTAEERGSLIEEIAEVKALAEQATAISENAKGAALLTALEMGFAAMKANGAADKAIIFTESRRTQDYLVRHLSAAGYADDLVLFNGSNDDERTRSIYAGWKEANEGTDRVSGSRTADVRQALVDHFRDSARIMIATEAAAEGINLQFCSLVINYDLPWNPQRIEQRIGRCHRYGQQHNVTVINFLNRANAADERVFDLLTDKLKLFEGIFGASDEVLGAVEAGVDFEKRILGIYQTFCTAAEITDAFERLWQELRPQIEAKLNDTRTALLENFDSEVADKLRHHKLEGDRYLTRIQSALWDLTRHVLADRAMFDPRDHAFTLGNRPYPDPAIPLGRYELTIGSTGPAHAHRYRLHHPLAQAVIREAKETPTPSAHLIFDYSGTPGTTAKLEPLVGQHGTLGIAILTIVTGDPEVGEVSEDRLIVVGRTDTGGRLDPAQIHALLALPADIDGEPPPSDAGVAGWLDEEAALQLQEIEERNAGHFQQESEKLDRWADDQRRAQKVKLEALDREAKELKQQEREARALAEKVGIRQRIRELDRRRDECWREFDGESRRIDSHRDEIESDALRMLQCCSRRDLLFIIEWTLK